MVKSKINFDNIDKKLNKYKDVKLNDVLLKQLREDLIIKWTYNSNAIEGSTFTLAETKVLLEDGITVGGKTMKEHFEIIGHAEAVYYVEDIVKISHNIISNNIKNKIINIAFKENIAIENLVNNFEKILKTKTEKEYIEIGESYSIDIQNIKAYFRNTDVNNYLENIINKYYK